MEQKQSFTEKPRILIVDDELGPRESLRMILKPSYEVYTAKDGISALEVIKKNPIDLVTLDLRMPGMPGEEVLKHIKNFDPTIEVIIITGYGTLHSAVEAIKYKVFDYILKPFNVPDILSVVKKCIERRYVSSKIKDVLEKTKRDAKSHSEIYDQITHFLNQLNESCYYFLKRESYLEFVRVLATTLESKDPYTLGHSERVCHYSSLIADGLRLSPDEKEKLQISAYLHDIGKVGISDIYISKDGPLDENEWAIVREHPIKGIKIISPLGLPSEVIEGIKYHHERFDGKGYPEGLSGKKIPLFARIIAIADAYDALTIGRPYKSPLSKNEALLEIKKCAGSQFDEELVEVFIEEIKKNDREINQMH